MISVILIKIALWLLPLTPESYKLVSPLCDEWVDRLNKVYWNVEGGNKNK